MEADPTRSDHVKIEVDEAHVVSGILQVPEQALACYVVAHGAGAGMSHPFMAAVADGLGQRRIATLRYQFPYMERGSKVPDRPPLAHATVRAAVIAAAELMPVGMQLVALAAGGALRHELGPYLAGGGVEYGRVEVDHAIEQPARADKLVQRPALGVLLREAVRGAAAQRGQN